MAKTSYISVPEGLEDSFFGSLSVGDRFTFPRMRRKDTLLSVKRKKGIRARSLLPQIAELWNAFSPAEKLSWDSAGSEMGLTGWKLFVQDQVIRIKNELIGVATPSLLHQSWVGQLKIASPSTEIKIGQFHPRSYWISKSVRGKKGMREPVLITEDFSLPFTIGLNYKSDLSVVGGSPSARFFARVWYSYQGQNLFLEKDIVLDLSSDWKTAETTLSSISGILISYDLFIHLKDVRGDLFFDNVRSEHSGQNWARDQYCKDIEQAFTRAFFQVPKHWVAIILPNGSEFDTIYKDF